MHKHCLMFATQVLDVFLLFADLLVHGMLFHGLVLLGSVPSSSNTYIPFHQLAVMLEQQGKTRREMYTVVDKLPITYTLEANKEQLMYLKSKGVFKKLVNNAKLINLTGVVSICSTLGLPNSIALSFTHPQTAISVATNSDEIQPSMITMPLLTADHSKEPCLQPSLPDALPLVNLTLEQINIKR